ncbi:hypothetical protein OBP_225 [Pseudomonas phage OBP]|uniref:hypothetical protein n=1 Tax=Pseudomonas phage OBP TaxID=1124849 RepID=UPI000240D5C5|nr:hypothetical protein OBP_225 [Pseudomonas phage OBP]AEV89662.1 hypothetical protein OBP_225 [Pseudomonas phage OBP]
MQLKFLFGTVRAIPEGSEDIIENVKLKDFLALTRKTDVFQHSDMRSMVVMGLSTGGFVKKLHNPERMDFYGESISCRVRTDESMDPIYAELIKTGTWWKHEFQQHKKTFTIFGVTEAGFKPSSGVSELNWVETTHADMLDIVRAEDEASNGW